MLIDRVSEWAAISGELSARLQIWKTGLLNLQRYADDLWAVEVWNVILRILIKRTKNMYRNHTRDTECVIVPIMIMMFILMTMMIVIEKIRSESGLPGNIAAARCFPQWGQGYEALFITMIIICVMLCHDHDCREIRHLVMS